MFTRAYLRASTSEQNASRAKKSLVEFAKSHDLKIAKFYIENESGAKLDRPKLNELLNDCEQGDILLIEDIDRLSRLNTGDWETLKSRIKAKQIRIVALNVPTTHTQATATNDETTNRILSAINDLLIDIMASVARRDYEQRKQRQRQGIENAKAKGVYKGKQADTKQYQRILKMVDSNHTYNEIKDTLGVSSATIAKAKKWRAEQSAPPDNEPLLINPTIEPTIKRRGRKPNL